MFGFDIISEIELIFIYDRKEYIYSVSNIYLKQNKYIPVSNIYLKPSMEFPRNLVIKLNNPSLLDLILNKKVKLGQMEKPIIRMAAKNNALQEIPVNHSNLFVDENNLTIDFNRSNTFKSELTHCFNSHLPDLAGIEEMIITNVIQSEINSEYLHLDMVIKRSFKKG